jgi:hypothetical protein
MARGPCSASDSATGVFHGENPGHGIQAPTEIRRGDFPASVDLSANLPKGYAFAPRKAGTDPKLDSDIDPATAKSKSLDLSIAEVDGQTIDHAKDRDIGLVVQTPGDADWEGFLSTERDSMSVRISKNWIARWRPI